MVPYFFFWKGTGFIFKNLSIVWSNLWEYWIQRVNGKQMLSIEKKEQYEQSVYKIIDFYKMLNRRLFFLIKNQLVKRLQELIWRRQYWLKYAIIVGLKCLPLFEYKYFTIFHKINTSCHYESWSENIDFQIVKKQRLTFEFDWKKKGDSTNGTNALIGTYKENHGWLIERGIVARFSFVDIVKKKNCGKNGMSYGKLPKVSEKTLRCFRRKNAGKTRWEKRCGNYLPYTSRYVTSYYVISGETISGDIISGDVTVPVTAPSQIRTRSNMTYYFCSFIQCASFLWNMSIY